MSAGTKGLSFGPIISVQQNPSRNANRATSVSATEVGGTTFTCALVL
ncbi:hypothetical protein PROFUN_10670 [Planoprotostelium fungivorum]|uniref:Uncharacterized protein n=1 Tax=Planoprotostelium fungivorum TaxID=1890364 RepID=A0A2P6MUV3_9EUKA|nr:hypothetical protein PROFUN_10670 [Planoprotostelium fungivorum]